MTVKGGAGKEPFIVGDWTVDSNSLTVSRGSESRAVEPRAFAVLLYLVERPGELITIDELLDAHWSGSVVTPNAVTRVIAHLRKVLDDDARNPRYIETVSRTGYRWRAPVGQSEKSAGPRVAWMVAAALLLAVVTIAIFNLRPADPAVPSIAVLPFENLTGDETLDYLGEGVAEEIIGALTHLPGVLVSARSRSFAYREPNLDFERIAAELGASYIVGGSVRRNGNDVRLTAQLVESKTGSHIWSQTVERDLAQLFDGQDVISAGIARAISEETGNVIPASDVHAAASPDPDAYDLYLRGRYIWHRRGDEPLQPAIDYFLEAVKIDPEFANGWSALATAYLSYPSYSPRGYRTWYLAEEAAMKALALDANLSEPYSVLAAFRYTKFQWDEAESLYLEAIRKNPQSSTAHFWYAEFLHITGRHTKATEHFRRTFDLDPTFIPPRLDVAFMHLDFHDYESAANGFLDLWQSGHRTSLAWLGNLMASVMNRRKDLAMEWIDVGPVDDTQKALLKRFVAVEFGDSTDANLGDELMQYFWRRPDYPVAIWLGALLGMYEDVFALANDRLDRGVLLELRPFWSPGSEISKQPGYVRLLDRIGLTDHWESSGWPDMCSRNGTVVTCDTTELVPGVLDAALSGDQ